MYDLGMLAYATHHGFDLSQKSMEMLVVPSTRLAVGVDRLSTPEEKKTINLQYNEMIAPDRPSWKVKSLEWMICGRRNEPMDPQGWTLFGSSRSFSIYDMS